MANYMIQDTTLAGIADAIRGKTGGADPIPVPDMSALIEGISSIPTLYSSDLSGATYLENHVIPDRDAVNTNPLGRLYESSQFMKRLYVGKNVVCTSSCFKGCTALEEATIAGTTGSEMFWNCTALKKCTLTDTASIGGNFTFDSCYALESVIIRGNRVLELGYSNIFVVCKQYTSAGGTGRIYVPVSQLDAYKVATNWTAFADKFLTIEDYPDITGG